MSGQAGSYRELGDRPYDSRVWEGDQKTPMTHSSAKAELVSYRVSVEGDVKLQELI